METQIAFIVGFSITIGVLYFFEMRARIRAERLLTARIVSVIKKDRENE